jgi:phage shock protein PspC (stress-responsive transcriptional regulator)
MLGVCRTFSKNTGLNLFAIRFIVILLLLCHPLITFVIYILLGLFAVDKETL